MAEEQFTLIMILKEVISSYEQKLEELKRINVSPLAKQKEEIAKVKEDSFQIIDFDMNQMESILQELQVSPEEKQKIMNYLRSIQTLLRLNRDKKTTFMIQPGQMEYVQELFEKIDEYAKERTAKEKESMQSIGKLSNHCEKYKELLRTLEDKDSTTYIDDSDLITTLMQECDLSEKTKQSILISLMKYNKKVFQRNLENKQSAKNTRIEEEALVSILHEHNYDFYELSPAVQEELKNKGDRKNIEEVLEVLAKYSFPRLNLSREGHKLALLLIHGNKDVIENIVLFSSQRGIAPRELMKILPCLIPQGRRKKRTKESISSNGALPNISGRSDDYVKNVEFLEKVGFRMDYIYQKCRELLVMSHQRLVNNYNAFVDYGFHFKTDSFGNLCHPALTCLLSANFAELADQFIEICPQGHAYIQNNMSRLNNILSPQDIVFYNIYASYQTSTIEGEFQVAEGPFVNRNSQKPMLRGEITRYPGSGYESIAYRGIEESNKKEATGTIDLPIKEKAKMEEAVQQSLESETEIKDIIGDELKELDPYIDPEDPVRYNLGGIMISRPKVRRIYNILKTYGFDQLEDSLLYAVTYNSIMNQEEFDRVKELLKGRWK